jgi:hypothetical protein
MTQLGMEYLSPLMYVTRFQAGTQLWVGGEGVVAIEHGTEVEHRTTYQERKDAAAVAVVDGVAGGTLVPGDADRLTRIEDREEVVGYAACLLGGDLRRANVQTTVALARVGIHYFTGLALSL